MVNTTSLSPSSPTVLGTAPDDDWKTLLDDAITSYEEKTGKKLHELPFAQDVEDCTTLDDFFGALDKHQKAFGDFRSQDERIRAILKPIASLTQAVIDPAAEAAATFVPGGKGIFVVVAAFLQASKRVSANYDALELVLLRFQPCLIRLEIYLGLNSFAQRRALRDAFLKILVLMIKIFGLLTTDLKAMHKLKRSRCWTTQKRIRDWVGQLLQADDTKDALSELDELTKQEELAAVMESLIAAEKARTAAEQAQSAALAAQVTALEARFAAEGAQNAAESAEAAADGAEVAAQGAEVAAEGGRLAALGAHFAAVGAEMAGERAALAALGAEEAAMQNVTITGTVHNNMVDDHIKTWLKLYDTGIRLNNLRNDKHEGTCEWFFDKKFEDWLETPNALYWVHGKPGAGKSVSMSALVERLRLHDMFFAFFFITYREVESQTVQNIQSSLVYQLATQMESCHKILEATYNTRGASLTAEQKTVSGCLMEMLKASPQRVILVLDGLDEYPNPGRSKSLLPFLEELHAAEIHHLRLLLASRPEHDIESSLKPLATHLLDLQDKMEIRGDDIASFVHAQLEKHCSRWSIATRKKAEKALNEKADGMFLWVSLQIDRLLECDADEIEGELANLPRDVKGTYDRIIKRLQANGSFHRSQRVLYSMAAYLSYSHESTSAAIAMVDLDWVDKNAMPQPPDLFDARDVIRRRGSSFVQIDEASNVRFVHFTAQEYVQGLADFDENKSDVTAFAAFTTAAVLKLVDPGDREDWLSLARRVREADVQPGLLSRIFDAPDVLLPQILDGLGETFAGSEIAKKYEAQTGQSAAELAAVFDSRLHWAMECGFIKTAEALLAEMGEEKSHSPPVQVTIRAAKKALGQEKPRKYYFDKNSWARGNPNVSKCIELQRAADGVAISP